MARTQTLLFLLVCFFLSSCSSENSGSQVGLENADGIRIQFLKPGSSEVVATHMVLQNEEQQLEFWRDAITDKTTEQTKCSPDGKIIFYERDNIMLEMEFQLEEGCDNISFVHNDQLHFRKLSDEALAWLKQKNVEYRM